MSITRQCERRCARRVPSPDFGKSMKVSITGVIVCLVTTLAAGGCGSLSNARKIDYRAARTLPPLEVPPGLSTTLKADELGVSQGPTTYSRYAGEREAHVSGSAAVLPEYPNVKLMREGQARYIVVKAEPDVVWKEVRDFLTKNGLSIAKENPKAGLLETNWAENRALVGASKSNPLAKVLKSLYSTGMRDKYRVRLERGKAPGTTEIYLNHEGMEEVAPDESESRGAQAGWKPRPSDPELEAEMLHRLVAYLGGSEGDATPVANGSTASGAQRSSAAESSPPPSARLSRDGSGTALLTLQDSLDRAWRRVGLSLDRIGFTVEDRDRSKGIYYVRYIDPDTQADKKGFFSRLFGGNKPGPSNQYQVHIKPAQDGTDVEVLDKEGGPAAAKTGERILSLLYEQLK